MVQRLRHKGMWGMRHKRSGASYLKSNHVFGELFKIQRERRAQVKFGGMFGK